MATWNDILASGDLDAEQFVTEPTMKALFNNTLALQEGPASGAGNVWGAHGPFVDVTTGLTEDTLITGFDKITLGGVDFPVWYWILEFHGITGDQGLNSRALELDFSKNGGGSLGTYQSALTFIDIEDPVDVHFRIKNYGLTGSRRIFIEDVGTNNTTGSGSSGSGRAYTGTADWNEITVRIATASGGITDGTLVRRAILYPGYL